MFVRLHTYFAMVLTLCLGLVSAQPGAFDLNSPANNDTLHLKTPFFHWQSSPNAQKYELWADNAKRADIPAVAKFPVQDYFDSTGFSAGQHTWYINAVGANDQKTKSSSTGTFTIKDFPGTLPYWAIGPFQKYGKNPILSPQGTGSNFESRNVLNPGVVVDDTACFQMVYRAQDAQNFSSIGYAHGLDGITFTRHPTWVIYHDIAMGENAGSEDPRLVKSGDTYYTYYTGADNTVKLNVASTKNFLTWNKYGTKIPKTKNACIVINSDGTPAKINGKYWLYHGDSYFTQGIMTLTSSTDLVNWKEEGTVNLHLPGGSSWGGWEPCIALADATPNGDDIVMLVAGKLWGDTWFNPSNPMWYYYAISEILFTKNNMTERLDRLDGVLMLPTEPYEENGEIKNCIFTNSLIKYRNRWWNHYGSGDRTISLMLATVNKTVLGPNLARNKTVTASTSAQPAANAVDSSCATRWASNAADNEWIMVDLGARHEVKRVILKWGVAYGKEYKLQVSPDSVAWTDAISVTGGTGEFDDLVFPAPKTGRYVRMQGATKGTPAGYSLWEFEVYGTAKAAAGHSITTASLCKELGGIRARENTLHFSVPRAGPVIVSVNSPQGKLLARAPFHAVAGSNAIRGWEAYRRLAPGTYCITLQSKGTGTIAGRGIKQ